MHIIARIFYIGKLLRGFLFICTLLQRSLVTSQILALSEVKAIMFLGRYVTRLVTYVLLRRVACVVIPSLGVCTRPFVEIACLLKKGNCMQRTDNSGDFYGGIQYLYGSLPFWWKTHSALNCGT